MITAPDSIKESELQQLVSTGPKNCDIELKRQNGKILFATVTIKIKVV